MSLVLQCSVYSGFGHGTQHTVLRTLYTVQALPQFFTWSPLQQNYMVKSFYRTLCYYYYCYYYIRYTSVIAIDFLFQHPSPNYVVWEAKRVST